MPPAAKGQSPLETHYGLLHNGLTAGQCAPVALQRAKSWRDSKGRSPLAAGGISYNARDSGLEKRKSLGYKTRYAGRMW